MYIERDVLWVLLVRKPKSLFFPISGWTLISRRKPAAVKSTCATCFKLCIRFSLHTERFLLERKVRCQPIPPSACLLSVILIRGIAAQDTFGLLVFLARAKHSLLKFPQFWWGAKSVVSRGFPML